MKIIIDIAARIKKAYPDDCEEYAEKRGDALVKAAHRMYISHMMDQNESAGVMAAHSLGEPGTQMNMRTFHYAGVASVTVTQGLPRLIEIVDARIHPATPSMTIPLVREIDGGPMDKGIATHIASEIEITTLLDVADIETDIDRTQLRIRPNMSKITNKGMTVEAIRDRLNKIKAVRGNVTIDADDNIIVSCPEGSYKKLQLMYDTIKDAKIKGIDGITRAVLSEKNGAFEIITEGSNLKDVLRVRGVDADHVMTNSILEVASVLGIEAARNALIHEAESTLGGAGLNVDARHIMLVADLMTNDGSVRSIGRHGISGKKSSVLSRAAFEVSTAHLLSAATAGEVDRLEGVTENIIVGQPVTLGTGAVNLEYRPKKRPAKDE